VLLTQELDATIRASEIAGIRSAIAAVRHLAPEASAESIEVAGGLVAFCGVDSALSQTVGVGYDRAVAAADVARITEFYALRGCAARVFVAPLANASLGCELAAAGYVPVEYDSMMASDSFDDHALRDARIAPSGNLDAWAIASLQGFGDHNATTNPPDELIAAIIAHSDGVVALEARDAGAIAATAAMDLRDGCAGFFAGSTIPAFRNSGLHVALIRDRIARARESGARFMRAWAQPGSISERHFRSCGFDVLYTRALWERKLERTHDLILPS
jgi:hypothetical protein